MLKAIAGSRTGRRSYLDLNSALFDPARAATTMRELLDQAEAQLAAARTLLLDQSGRAERSEATGRLPRRGRLGFTAPGRDHSADAAPRRSQA